MLNPSDKELDRLSREAAEQFEPDEEISSWEKLELLLDKGLGNKPSFTPRRFGRGPIGYSIMVLMVAGLSYFFLKQDMHSRQSKLDPSNQINNKSVTAAAKTDDASHKQNNAALDSKDALSSTGVDKQSSAADQSLKADKEPSTESIDHSTKVKAANSKVKTAGIEPAHTQPNNKPASKADKTLVKAGALSGIGAAVGINNSNKIQNKNTGNKQKDIVDGKAIENQRNLPVDGLAIGLTGPPADNAIDATNHVGSNQKNNSVASVGSVGLSMAILPDPELIADPAKSIDDASLRNYSPVKDSSNSSSADQDKKNSASLHINRSLKIGFAIGPDVTSVNSVAPDKLSSNYGLTLGYEFLKGWSINTGIIYTKKNYSANGHDFHAPAGTFPPYVDPEYVTGNCSMYEIPLTLRYDAEIAGKTTFFVNAGLSSYLMKHEAYVYSGHKDYNGIIVPWTSAEIPYDTHKNYLFSVIDLSFGVEQRISKGFSFQIEPFFKIPVKGVGLGQLELSSYGISFSLRYAPVLSKSRH